MKLLFKSAVALSLLSGIAFLAEALRPLEPSHGESTTAAAAVEVRLLAVGDINLGRTLGRRLLRGDSLYPWLAIRDSLVTYDIVFGNLESIISDQQGETEDPRSNTVFTAPPVAARSLRQAGFTILSTANNHALDYGSLSLAESLRRLKDAGIAYAGSAEAGETPYRPAIVTVKGVRFAFFAVTAIMNGEPDGWQHQVAEADTSRLLPAIRAVRDSVDFVVVSYHGGEEYADRATEMTRIFCRNVMDGGADLVLGHHPHVPYGLDQSGGRLAAHSLGNFVFVQRPFWTQRSFALETTIVKEAGRTRLHAFRCLPVKVGYQPKIIASQDDARVIFERIRSLSSRDTTEHTP